MQTRRVQNWTVVIPVKGTAASKSRFGPGDHRDLALAMALDTVEAALAVAPVVVVTVGGAEFQALGASVVQDPGAGLIAAIEAGLEVVGSNSAVLLGDHPALRPAELEDALAAAEAHPRSLVADDDGTGTALVTALGGTPHDLAFGAGSRALHLDRGYVELAGDWPGLRRDVDLVEHLDALALAGLALGRHSRALAGRVAS
ncbi:2-phospho-L-lactate guanylyltransferase [Schumannella luteola]